MNHITGPAVLVALMAFISASGLQAQDFGGGSGTPGDPWQVQTAEHLDSIRHYLGAAHEDKHFRLMNSIDLSDAFLPGGQFYNEGLGWAAIGNSPSSHFGGSFDGDGHAIIGLFINRNSDYQGLFGYVLNSSIVNTSVEDADVTGQNMIGALVGFNHGTVDGCHSSGIVKGGYRVGGLVGENNPGAVQNSSSSATIEAADGRIGGLVGFNVGGTVEHSFATGQVSGGWYSGGLVGRNLNGVVRQSYATGTVHSSSVAGGLVGDTEGGSISDCYATGAVTAGSWFGGGLIGYLWSTAVSTSYSTGQVSGGEDLGGLVGDRFGGSVSDSYWNTETSGHHSSAGGLGRTTAEMTYPHAGNTYVGWNFAETWQQDVDHAINAGYPFLFWQVPDMTGVEESMQPQVSLFNFPNPFNPATRIAFGLVEPSQVALRIYDASGRLVRVLVKGMRTAGKHEEMWDGCDGAGRVVASGVYFYRLDAGSYRQTRSMTLLR